MAFQHNQTQRNNCITCVRGTSVVKGWRDERREPPPPEAEALPQARTVFEKCWTEARIQVARMALTIKLGPHRLLWWCSCGVYFMSSSPHTQHLICVCTQLMSARPTTIHTLGALKEQLTMMASANIQNKSRASHLHKRR